ncbi:hypothetical protein VZT92_015253 [Zoarces viviparus]|uniref:Secreted protein n=1 Tax=Zoarces viviparus TaxID=48416 RepID=A0AAW1EWF2_ZOAVI
MSHVARVALSAAVSYNVTSGGKEAEAGYDRCVPLADGRRNHLTKSQGKLTGERRESVERKRERKSSRHNKMTRTGQDSAGRGQDRRGHPEERAAVPPET